MKYSIYEAKARLSEVIRHAKARRRVIITERGIPVAEVVPYAEEASESLSRRIAGLSNRGAIVPRKEPFRPQPVCIRKGAVRRFLSRDRD